MVFKIVELGELCEIKSSKRIYAKDYKESGVPFYRSKEIIQKHNNQEVTTELYISEEQFESIKSKYDVPKSGDILLTSVGTLGIPYLVNSSDEFYFKDGNLTWFSNFESKINGRYLYYWFTSKMGKNEIDRITIGSTQKALTIVNLKKMKISLPPLEIQNKLVFILDSINEKIKNNLAIIDNLEAITSLLFKRFFIDFEFPNEQGLPYRSSGGEMVESELGEIPKGWKVYSLGGFTSSISKSINKKTTEYARFLNTSDILEGNIEKVQLTLTKDMPGQAKKLIEEGDILYSEIRPKNKRFAYVNFDSSEYVVSTKLMVIRVDEDVYSSKLLYLWLTQPETISTLQSIAEDRSGTFPQITFSILADFKFAISNREKLREFESVFTPLFDKILAIKEENEKLVELRDNLLPKLLSGEIEIPDESVVNPS